jgi:hypothetical protein
VRLFIAIELDEDARVAIAAVALIRSRLSQAGPV